MANAAHQRRARLVGAMFERIAPRYDLLNRLISLGFDRSWRRLAVAAAAPAGGSLALDAGAGTADLSIALARWSRAQRVIGVDLSAAMLSEGVRKTSSAGLQQRIELLQADVTRLPFATATFACITTAFMVRNLADLSAALAEMQRVLIDGGRLVILEITRPRPDPAGRLFSLYFRRVVPLLGGLVSGDRAAYRYLPASVDRFLTAAQLTNALRTSGFAEVDARLLGPGPVALHLATKREPRGA
jgi:demethylmenaquinone methyltransferase/2-methoxy-6-polyprenyl-1,4-benzoquinol methylase